MKHLYGIMGLVAGAVLLASITMVSADTGMTITTTGTGSIGATGSAKKLERHEDRMQLLQTIHDNREATRDANKLSTKTFASTSKELRKGAAEACKAIIAQVESGSLTKEEGLAQCKELKSTLEATLKSMRSDMTKARKAAREATKEKNQGMRDEFKAEHKPGTGDMGTGDDRKPPKPPKSERSGTGDMMGTGEVGTGAGVKPPKPPKPPKADKPKRPGTGEVATGDVRPIV